MANRRDIDRLNELEELFADLWQVPRFAAGLRRGYRPQADCYRTDEPELTVILELPGADPDKLRIVTSGRTLVVAGERPRPRCEGQVYFRSEIEYGPFQRELELNEEVDADGAVATYENGLLKIVFPISQRPQGPVRVPIELKARP